MGDYAYINARVRALRGDLLDQRAYEQLLVQPDIPSARDCLARTVYGKRVGDIPGGAPIMVLEEWLREEWSRTVSKLHRMTEGRSREHLEVVLGRWEVENIKAILRGKRADIGISEILATVLPTGLFDGPALAELARQPSIQAIVDLLTTWRSHYARPLREALRAHRELKGLEPLELALDHYYFEDAMRRLEEGNHSALLLRKLIGLLIDRVNLLTAFKIFSGGATSRSEIPNYFIKGGIHLPIQVYDALVRAQGLMEVIEVIRKTPYSSSVKGLEGEQRGIPSSLRLERGLDQIILERVRAMGSSDPLGIGLLVGYLLQKYHEVGNLRMILRAKAYGMYSEDVRSLLVM